MGDYSSPGVLAKYDVSTKPAPALLQRIQVSGPESYGKEVAVAPNWQFLLTSTGDFIAGSLKFTAVRSAADLAVTKGTFTPPTSDRQTAISTDSSIAFRQWGTARKSMFLTSRLERVSERSLYRIAQRSAVISLLSPWTAATPICLWL